MKKSIREFADPFLDIAITARMTSDFLLAIAEDPEWIWPVRSTCLGDCLVNFHSNSGTLVYATISLDGFEYTACNRPTRHFCSFSDLSEFCKALKAELQK